MTGRIHMRHVRQLRGRGVTCAAGIRAWCTQHGVDLRQLASEGIPVEVVQRIGGPFVERLLEIQRTEAQRDGR